jgi:hypothetical protein
MSIANDKLFAIEKEEKNKTVSIENLWKNRK